MIETLPQVFKRLHYPVEIILVCVRWYVACPLSLRHLGETMSERGVMVDHSTIHRWAINMLPVLAAVFRRRKRPVGKRWRMDETFVRVAGQWTYLYRAVDKEGDTIAFLLRARRDHAAARAFFERAIAPSRRTRENHDRQRRLRHRRHCEHPGRHRLGHRNAPVEVPQQHHRAIERITRPMLGFKTFRCARIFIAGIEVMHRIRKGQPRDIKDPP
jgi:putative transposase